MNAPLRAELLTIFRAIKINSPDSFTFAGKSFPQLAPGLSQWQNTPTQNPLVAQLAFQLYNYCYCKRFKGTLPDAQVLSPPPDDNILAELSAANFGQERWDGGWQTHRLMPSGQIIAQKGGLTRLFWPGEFVSHEGPGIAMREGARISIYAPKESNTMQPGFYFVFSEAIADQQDDYNLVRFYWHLKDSGAPLLVRLLTQEFNRFQLPFRFKSLASRTFYQRADAAVLYINKRFYRITVELLARIQHQLVEHLGADTPLFTKPLAHGLGLAEEPGNGESFGQHRCRIVAESLWNAYEKGLQTEQECLQETEQRFAHYGLTLDSPYLNPGSTDQYFFPSTSASS